MVQVQFGPTRHLGFTIVELMITVAITALLAALAAPSVRTLIENQRLKSIHQAATTDLQFARSEAVRRGVPVHFAVRPAAGTAGACYIIFTDTNVFSPFSTACDCSQPAGSRCTDSATSEIKTVQLDPALHVGFSIGSTTRVPFDPYSGAVLVPRVDRLSRLPPRMELDSQVDASSARSMRTIVEYTGKPSVCIPAGSSITAFGAPSC